MKRIYILFFLVCGVVIASCTSTTYTGESDIRKPDVGYEQEPVPVTLRMGNASYVTNTRGTGEFGSLADNHSSEADVIQWNNARFYVYAFAKGEDVDLSTCWDDPKNVDESICLIDATRPGKKSITEETRVAPDLKGKETYIEQEGYSYLYWKKEKDDNDSPIYYNVVDRERPYNFFAYYVDDAEITNFQREHDRIYFDVTIDGQQDLMAAMAEPTKVQIDKLKSNPNKDKILETAFSAYSGNYDLSPVFEFKHQLVCLKFAIYPAGELKLEEGDEEKEENIKKLDCYSLNMTAIKVLNPQTKGVFTVATNDQEAYPQRVEFPYPPEEGADPFVVQKKVVKDGTLTFEPTAGNLSEMVQYWKEDKEISPYYKRHGQSLDGSVLLASQSSYTLELSLDGELVDGNYNGETFKLEILPPTGSDAFESGKCYVVRLGIFGRQLIKSDVSLGKWEQGGNIEFKPEG